MTRFEQFAQAEVVMYEESEADFDKWIFDREAFMNKLQSQLPVNDFFGWCYKALQNDFDHIETEKFFALTGLLFDESLQIDFPKKNERVELKTTTSHLSVPKLKVEPSIKF